MNFQVPQFIEIEDKIFGPLTFRQFVYLGGGAGLCYLLYRLLPFYLALFPILFVGGFAAALALVKINKRPFILIVEAAIKYQLSKKLFLWRHEPAANLSVKNSNANAPTPIVAPKLSASKLKELAWSLDIKERIKE